MRSRPPCSRHPSPPTHLSRRSIKKTAPPEKFCRTRVKPDFNPTARARAITSHGSRNFAKSACATNSERKAASPPSPPTRNASRRFQKYQSNTPADHARRKRRRLRLLPRLAAKGPRLLGVHAVIAESYEPFIAQIWSAWNSPTQFEPDKMPNR